MRSLADHIVRNKIDWHVIFILSLCVFYFLFSVPGFPDPDSFYHARMSELILHNGPVMEFPWLPFTALNKNFADHHFLYHLLVAPFILIFKDPLIGLKAANIIFGALAASVFYWVLKRYAPKGRLFFIMLLLGTAPFLYRLSLAKAQPLSLIMVMLGMHFIFQKKYAALFGLSFIYVWTYGGWPLMIFIAAAYIFAAALKDSLCAEKRTRAFFLALFSADNMKILLSVLWGLAAGLVINPYFPQNMIFYKEQILKIALVNYKDMIGVGAEWYAYPNLSLAKDIMLLLAVFLNASALFFATAKEQARRSFFFFIIAVSFYFLTMRSRRNVEYLVPFLALSSAFSINGFLDSNDARHLYGFFRPKFGRLRPLTGSLLIGLGLIGGGFSCYNIYIAKKELSSGIPCGKFAKIGAWLKENSPAGSTVFHSDWDDFPMLFYHDPFNKYIVGLDPTFMFSYSPELYWKWRDITVGETVGDPYGIIKNDFGATFTVVGKDTPGMRKIMKNEPGLQLVYEDGDGWIYKTLSSNTITK